MHQDSDRVTEMPNLSKPEAAQRDKLHKSHQSTDRNENGGHAPIRKVEINLTQLTGKKSGGLPRHGATAMVRSNTLRSPTLESSVCA